METGDNKLLELNSIPLELLVNKLVEQQVYPLDLVYSCTKIEAIAEDYDKLEKELLHKLYTKYYLEKPELLHEAILSLQGSRILDSIIESIIR